MTQQDSNERDDFAPVVDAVVGELFRANAKFPGFNSAHEGHSVIREELEELWEHVKGDTGYSDAAWNEAKQTAAMAMKYMLMIRERNRTERAAEKGTR